MAPSKADVENVVVESSKRKEVEGEGMSSITSSLTHLTLDADTHKDVAELEDDLAQMNLRDRSVLEEEKEEERDGEKEVNGVKEAKRISCEREKLLLPDSEVVAKEDEDKEEEKEKEEEDDEEEIKKEEGEEKEEAEEIEKKEDDKLKKEEKEEEEEKEEDEKYATSKLEKEKEKKRKEEEEVSDDENPVDDDEKSRKSQPKDGRIRSRGLGRGMGHEYAHVPNMDYMGAGSYQQQQQQQQEMLSRAAHQYQGAWSPQHGQMAGYPGASPPSSGAMGDAWYGSDHLASENGKTFTPGLEEYSPASCSSGEGDISNTSYGYSAGSPLSYDDGYGNSSLYHHGMSHSPQYQEPQPSVYHQHQYQEDQVSSYHQGIPQNIQYQDNQATAYHQGSPQVLSPMQYPELAYQESPYSTQLSPQSVSSCSSQLHSSILTPPVSPQPVKPPSVKSTQYEDIANIIESYSGTGQEHFDIPPHDSTMIEILKNLLEIGNCPHTNLEDELDQTVYQIHYREYAAMENEVLVDGDEDGDILYLRAACTGQMEQGYNEKLVAFTNRVEKMNLCCDAVVDWRIRRCQICGNSDPNTFYSPLSWRNKHGEMLLSNLVILMFPEQVIQYVTKKVMQRPMDFRRTFVPYSELFAEKTELYPCLLQGLRMLKTG